MTTWLGISLCLHWLDPNFEKLTPKVRHFGTLTFVEHGAHLIEAESWYRRLPGSQKQAIRLARGTATCAYCIWRSTQLRWHSEVHRRDTAVITWHIHSTEGVRISNWSRMINMKGPAGYRDWYCEGLGQRSKILYSTAQHLRVHITTFFRLFQCFSRRKDVWCQSFIGAYYTLFPPFLNFSFSALSRPLHLRAYMASETWLWPSFNGDFQLSTYCDCENKHFWSSFSLSRKCKSSRFWTAIRVPGARAQSSRNLTARPRGFLSRNLSFWHFLHVLSHKSILWWTNYELLPNFTRLSAHGLTRIIQERMDKITIRSW